MNDRRCFFRNKQRSSERNWKIKRIPSPFCNQISKAEKFHSFVQIRSKSHFENEQMFKAASRLITFPHLNWQSCTFWSTSMFIILAIHNKFSWLSRFKDIICTHTLSNGSKLIILSTGLSFTWFKFGIWNQTHGFGVYYLLSIELSIIILTSLMLFTPLSHLKRYKLYYVLACMSIQTCMTYFLLWNKIF